MNTLEGKIAVVTGASKGIGASIARHLASEGAAVVVNYATSQAGADKVVADITSAGGTATAVQGDFSKPEDITRVFAAVRKQYGKLNILVNNAGVYNFGPVEEVTPAEFHRQFNLNVLGLLLVHAGRPAALRPGGRLGHQHRLHRRLHAARLRLDLHGHQGRGGRDHGFALQGVGRA